MHGNKQLEAVITDAAWAVTHTKNTFYRARYHRLTVRRGKKKGLDSSRTPDPEIGMAYA